MESMTGYGYIEGKTAEFSFSVEIKSLNSKYLEVYSNTPKMLKKKEDEIILKLKDRFLRGKIVATIEIFNWTQERTALINQKMIKKYYDGIQALEKSLGVENYFPGDLLFSFDGVLQKEKFVLAQKSYDRIIDHLQKAIALCIKMRMQDGNGAKRDLKNSLLVISTDLRKIKRLSKDVSDKMYSKMKKNIEIFLEQKADPIRLYTEIAILADRMDINEEIVRLEDHLKKFREMMLDKGQIGKSLDFLAQEMFREINTISSKANSSVVSHLVVEMKNHVDKIREQCRNIV